MARFFALLSMYSGTASAMLGIMLIVGLWQNKIDDNPWKAVFLFSAGVPAIITGSIDYAKLPKSEQK